ncbi:MAG TPA: chemotaxis protein CheW [Gemmatimonadaceae bacterium]|nr:chemotaxis protein CheW [Gemmatimonadaceae bacterium]
MNHDSTPTTTSAHPAVTPAEGGPVRFRERARLRAGAAEVLVFRIGREWCGLELQAVLEVVDAPDVRPIPESPPALLGVFPLRGALLPLYAPGAVLGIPADGSALALVMRRRGGRLAIAVDDVDEVLRIDLSALRDPPPGVHTDDAVVGILLRPGHLITVLDARALVSACFVQAPAGMT